MISTLPFPSYALYTYHGSTDYDVLVYSGFHRNSVPWIINLLKPTGHVMHQKFNIQQLYVLPTLYLCDLYLSENKQRLVPLTT